MLYLTDGVEEYPQVTVHVVSGRSKFTEVSTYRALTLFPTSTSMRVCWSLVKYMTQRKFPSPGRSQHSLMMRLNSHPQRPRSLRALLQKSN